MVLATQVRQLDLAYMRHWCAQHATLPLLEQMLKTVAESEQKGPMIAPFQGDLL